MASLNDRDAGREFSGNGAGSFDGVSYRVSAGEVAPASPAVQAALDSAEAIILKAFYPAPASVRRAAA